MTNLRTINRDQLVIMEDKARYARHEMMADEVLACCAYIRELWALCDEALPHVQHRGVAAKLAQVTRGNRV